MKLRKCIKKSSSFIHYSLTLVLLGWLLYSFILIQKYGIIEIYENNQIILFTEIVVVALLFIVILCCTLRSFFILFLSSKKSLRHTDDDRVESPQGSQSEYQHENPLNDFQTTGKKSEVKHYQ